MKTALTIAGSDSSGGAGIQADIKTMMANGVYAMSAITALTAQNTTGVAAIQNATPEFLAQEIDSIFTDIEPDAVKVDAVDTLKKELFHLATILTPNIPEAEELAQIKINNSKDMIKAAEKIAKTYNCAVLCKGGHNQNDASDLLYKDNEFKWFHGKRIDNPNTHGTGCTLSSAIASNLAKGYDLEESVFRAKEYISGALAAMLDLGKGSGPMNHGFAITNEYTKVK